MFLTGLRAQLQVFLIRAYTQLGLMSICFSKEWFVQSDVLVSGGRSVVAGLPTSGLSGGLTGNVFATDEENTDDCSS